jgi:hypothetical protein
MARLHTWNSRPLEAATCSTTTHQRSSNTAEQRQHAARGSCFTTQVSSAVAICAESLHISSLYMVLSCRVESPWLGSIVYNDTKLLIIPTPVCVPHLHDECVAVSYLLGQPGNALPVTHQQHLVRTKVHLKQQAAATQGSIHTHVRQSIGNNCHGSGCTQHTLFAKWLHLASS